ncbi:MAG: metalloprotease TldD, partial [Proteobacteria bacterium]|nr:metalloprotease TldD [Pseudomonadota bacterium]
MDQEEALFEEQETVLQLPTGTPDQMAKALLEGQMGVTDSHMRQVLQAALSRGGDYADLYFEYAYRTSVVMEESIIKNSSISISKGVGVRVLKGDQTGYAYSEDLSLYAMQRAARTAASIATSATVKEHEGYRFNRLKPSNHYPVMRTVTDLPLADKITKIQAAERAAHDYDPRIKRVTVSMVDTVDIVRIVTSDERFVSDVRPMFRMNVHCVAQEEKNVQTGSAGVGGRVGLPFLEA